MFLNVRVLIVVKWQISHVHCHSSSLVCILQLVLAQRSNSIGNWQLRPFTGRRCRFLLCFLNLEEDFTGVKMNLTPLSIFGSFMPTMNALMLLALHIGIDNIMKIFIHQVILRTTTNVRHAGKQMIRMDGWESCRIEEAG